MTNPQHLQDSGSVWTIYVCPICGGGPFNEGDAQIHAAVRCEPDAWPWEPVEVVPLDASFDGLLSIAREIMDRHYPADLFPSKAFPERDPGVQLVMAIRAVDEARQ